MVPTGMSVLQWLKELRLYEVIEDAGARDATLSSGR
jgi:hypothetical protein